MHVFRRILLFFLISISFLITVLSVASLFHDVTRWYFEMVDFPRLQYMLAAVVCIPALIVVKKHRDWTLWLLITGLAGTIVIQATYIFPYWLGEKKVPDATATRTSNSGSVGILIANILIKNRQADTFLRLVREVNPDVVLVMEVNTWWVNQLQALKNTYPHVMECPLDNGYGMALYSRLPLRDEQIKYFDDEKIPSFLAKVLLPNGRSFQFYGVHPVAPYPSDKYPDGKGEKEVTLLQVGNMVNQDTIPSVVAGDFNDVSWSYTSELFSARGKLNNVRLGRGLFNSFDADSPVARWPLDHFFVTKEFQLQQLERLPDIESDHFPVFTRLVLPE
ncbi:endonuclease/exonuclease/phosphatase family protein [Nibrella viscosa]|uniref:Endonuclease/exonuclease/phosphatase family protein n=1 Tax=Nibrella viscosa TaxID=1084524 RepID=A0ABP8KRK5_9BACT